MGYGCRYLKMDKKTYTEKCMITGNSTRGSVVCDCYFENCAHYQEAKRPIKPEKAKGQSGQLPGQMSMF